jgi:hypothetical protein
MSANLLSLNQSKTVLLLIGLPKQLSKLSDMLWSSHASQIPMLRLLLLTRSARITSVSYSTHLSPCRIIFLLCLNFALWLFVTFVVPKILSIPLQLKLSLYVSHSFQGRLLQLSFSIFLVVNLIVFSWFSTLLLMLFLKLLGSPIFHLF